MSAGPFISRESWETGSFSDLSIFETETQTHTKKEATTMLQVTSHKNSPSHRNRVFFICFFHPQSAHVHAPAPSPQQDR